ncbi:hypothetical protein Tco_1121480 [Tanacetum coccineum]|uniref:Uncharacterized protein n=1 Tax=Tanacetum coccineum TaxID=301880 RepID=A0ABQ5IZ75_9ASTR
MGRPVHHGKRIRSYSRLLCSINAQWKGMLVGSEKLEVRGKGGRGPVYGGDGIWGDNERRGRELVWYMAIIQTRNEALRSLLARKLMRSLRRHLEEIHVTWALFWKKQDKIATLHKRRLEELITEGGDGVRNTCDAVWIIKRPR